MAPTAKRRCYTGCNICRARKVKCDERPGGCANCERLGLQCPAQDVALTHSEVSKPPAGRRKKTYRSCLRCRYSKTRCSGDRPVCTRCQRKQVECEYDAEPEPAWSRAVFQSTSDDYSADQHAPEFDGVNTSFDLDCRSEQRQSGQQDSNAVKSSAASDSPIAWLYTQQLPPKSKVLQLADQYFAHIHPLRSFGFIHRPNFVQRISDGLPPGNPTHALIYAVCALGAKFLALDYTLSGSYLEAHEVLAAGSQWAKESLRLVFADLDVISVELLMAVVLLHDHELRVGRYASCFLLSGLGARLAQALQINVEYSTDILCAQAASAKAPSPTARESRRRLQWAVYVMDAWVGSGVDQLTCLRDEDILVQLPCDEDHFIEAAPVITEVLEPGCILKFIPASTVDPRPVENMGMTAWFVRLTSYRKQVLRYVKHLDEAQPPWLPESEFSTLDQRLHRWYDGLPEGLKFSTSAIYIRTERSQLCALTLLHVSYHQTMCDLYRIGMPRLFKIRTKIQYPPEKLDFLAKVQHTCFFHAQQIAFILRTALEHGVKTLADTWLAVVAHDTNRVMLYYITKVVSESHRSTVLETIPLIRSNLDVLKAMMPLFSMAKVLFDASRAMISKSNLGDEICGPSMNSRSNESVEGPTAPGTPVQATPDYVLNPLAIYRLARKAVPENEKHAPELIANTSAEGEKRNDAEISSSWLDPPYSTNNLVFTARDTQHPPYSTLQPSAPSVASEFSDLDMFFSSNVDHIWQPAETILESSQWGGIAPWESFQMNLMGAGPIMNTEWPSYQEPGTT